MAIKKTPPIKIIDDDHSIVTISMGDKIIRLHFKDFDADIDIDDLTMIHHENIIGEILTVSTLMNRVGLLKAEAANNVRESDLGVKIEYSRLSEHYRKTLKKVNGEKIKYATIDEVSDAVTLDPSYQNLMKRHFRIQKELDQLESLYWAIKSKDGKVDKLSERLKPEEFEKEIVEGVINTINVKAHKKLF